MTNLAVRLSSVPLNRIKCDPLLVHDALEIKKHFAPDETRIKKYASILDDFAFQEPLKVWQTQDDAFYLLHNYECYKALETAHAENPSQEVSCLVLSGGNRVEMKALAARLDSLGPAKSHLNRCLNVRSLMDIGFSLPKIREIYGVKKSHSAEGKRIERDYKICRHHSVLRRVLGLEQAERESILSELVASDPSDLSKTAPGKATLQYGLAERIVSILMDDDQQVRLFDERYGEYLERLQESHLIEDEQTKPIFQWTKYRREDVLQIAAAVARGTDNITFNDQQALIGDAGLADERWNLANNELTSLYAIPRISINLSLKSPSNLKKIVEIQHKAEKLAHSLRSYLHRISPVEHGAKIRISDPHISPALDTQSNMPQFEDHSYVTYIMTTKLLAYCNRELLLKSLSLKAHYFGFDSYAHDSRSTYEKAYGSFMKWMESLKRDVIDLRYSGKIEKHPKFQFYSGITVFLKARAQDSSVIAFSDFINEMFRAIFSDLEQQRQAMSEKVKRTVELTNSANTRTKEVILSKLGEVGLSSEEVFAALQSDYIPDANRTLRSISALEERISKLTLVSDEESGVEG